MVKKVLLIDVDMEKAHPGSRTGSTLRGHHPLGLLYLVSAARKEFPYITFRVFHTLTSERPIEEIQTILRDFNPNLIGLRALSVAQEAFKKIAKTIRSQKPDSNLIAGGPYPSSSFKELLMSKDVDLVVIGEGEKAFVDLIRKIQQESKLPRNVPGTAVLDNGQVRINDPQPWIDNLDTIPFPNYDYINLDDYKGIYTQAYYQTWDKSAFIYASRGCPYNCGYCHQLFGKKIRRRSAENIVAEMRDHREKRNIIHFGFVDDIFNVPKKEAKKTLSLIAKELPGIRLNFPNGLRADQLDEEIIDLFEKAGTVQMSLALETASPRLQKMIEKNLNLDRMQENVRAASQKFIVRLFCMIGFPSETYDEAMKTIQFVDTIDCIAFPILSIVHVYEGTSLYNMLHPSKEEAQALSRQERVPHTAKLFFDDVFYGNFFSKEKVPLKSKDIKELRYKWLEILNNPNRIKHAHRILQKHLNPEEILGFYKVFYDNPRFDEQRLQRLLNTQ